MLDRTNSLSENPFHNSEQRRHEHPQWVIKYLDLADTALGQKPDDEEQRPAA